MPVFDFDPFELRNCLHRAEVSHIVRIVGAQKDMVAAGKRDQVVERLGVVGDDVKVEILEKSHGRPMDLILALRPDLVSMLPPSDDVRKLSSGMGQNDFESRVFLPFSSHSSKKV